MITVTAATVALLEIEIVKVTARHEYREVCRYFLDGQWQSQIKLGMVKWYL